MAYSENGAINSIQGTTQARDTISGFGADHIRHVERLAKMVMALKLIGDRIDGPRPEPVAPDGAGNPEAPPASMIVQFKRSHMQTSNLLSQCEDEIRRLGAVLGIQ